MICRLRSSGIVLVCLLSATLRAAAQDPPATQPAGPRLELSPREWNFGTAWQGQPLKLDVTLRNVGDAPLEIRDVHSSCGCTVPTKPRSPLAPGESDTMTVTYDSAKRLGKADQTVTLTTNDPTQVHASWRLSGEVKAAFETDPRDGLVFGQLKSSSQDQRKVQVINKYTAPMNLRLKEGQNFGPFQVELQEIEPGQRYGLTATTKPPLGIGRFQSDVTLLTGLEMLPEISVQLYAFVPAPVTVRPTKLFLPKNAVSERTQVIRVARANDYPMTVTAVRSNHESIKTKMEVVQAESGGVMLDSYQIAVTLPPGNQIPEGLTPQIEITTDAKDAEYQRLIVPVEIIGSQPHTMTRPAAPGAVQTPPSVATPSGQPPPTTQAQTSGK